MQNINASNQDKFIDESFQSTKGSCERIFEGLVI